MCTAWLDNYHKNYLANSLARPNWDHMQYPTRHVHRFNFYGEQRCRISTGNFRIINDKQGCKVNGFDWGESMKLVHVLATLLNDYLMFSIKLWLNSLFRTNRVANEDTLIGATVWDVCIFSLARLIIILVYSLFYLFLLFCLFSCLCFLSSNKWWSVHTGQCKCWGFSAARRLRNSSVYIWNGLGINGSNLNLTCAYSYCWPWQTLM